MLFAEEVATGMPVTWPQVVFTAVSGLLTVAGLWANWRFGTARRALEERVEETERKARVMRKKFLRSQRLSIERDAECERRFEEMKADHQSRFDALEKKHSEQLAFERRRAHDYKELVYAVATKLGMPHEDVTALILKHIPDATPSRPFAIYLPGRDTIPGPLPHLPPPSPPPTRPQTETGHE